MKKRLVAALLVLIILSGAMVQGCAMSPCSMIPSGNDEDAYYSIMSPPQACQADSSSDNISWVITWETDRPGSSQVAYGVTETYGSLTPLDRALVTTHSVTLTGLKPSTTYNYNVISIDEAGNRAEYPGDPFTTATQFTFVSSQVILGKDDYGNANACLKIRFNASEAVSFKLTNPDGLLAGTGSAERGVTGAILPMAGGGETPKAGTYTLLVEGGDQWSQTVTEIATETIEYQGANATISDFSSTWTFPTSDQDESVTNLSFKVSNTGDLPVFISQGECSLGGRPVALTVSGAVLPGETKAMSASASGKISEIPAGPGTFTMTLKDSQGTVAATWTAPCQGAAASISNLSLEWSYSSYSQDYTLDSFSFRVSNTGDLPVYIELGQWSLGGTPSTLMLSEPGTVMPGVTKSFSSSPYSSGIPAGQKTFTLTLKDHQGAVVATYTAGVTPG